MQTEEHQFCAGCRLSVSNDTGDVVVVFGTSLWHMECFKCAKCNNLVNPDTNLLLLSDGSPVCANCYICKACKKPILDEAVMTGDDSFHADCFTCRSCKSRINELVFAKTVNGFYCMKCHNERVARSRRHLAKQKQRERAPRVSGNTDSRSDLPSAPSTTNTPPSNGDSNDASSRMESKAPVLSQRTSVSPSRADNSSPNEALANGSNQISHSQSGTTTGSSCVSPVEPYTSLERRASSPTPIISSNGSSDVGSAHNSALPGHNGPSTETPTPGSCGDHAISDSHILEATSSRGSFSPSERAIEHSNDESRKKSHNDGARPSSLQPRPTESYNHSKKREKCSSVDSELRIESSGAKQDRTNHDHLSISSPKSSSARATVRNKFSPVHLEEREAPCVTSPLREQFVGNGSSEAESAAQYSPAASPHPTSPTSPKSFAGSILGSPHGLGPGRSLAPTFPQRLDSLRNGDGTSRVTARGRERALPQPLKLKRASEEGDLRPSPRPSDIGNDGVRSRPISPRPPDVPRSIESGTDTETENGLDADDIMQTYLERKSSDSYREANPDNAPPPPPKDLKGSHESEGLNGGNSLQLIEDNIGSDTDKDHEEHASQATVSQRMSTFFATPELPPMRFSLTRDLHDLLNNFNDSANRLSLISQHGALPGNLTEKSEEISVVRTPTSIASTITPSNPRNEDMKNTGSERRLSGSRQACETENASEEPDKQPILTEDSGSGLTSTKNSGPLSPRLSPGNENPDNKESAQNLSTIVDPNGLVEQDPVESIIQKVKKTLADAKERSVDHVKLDCAVASAMLDVLDQRKQQVHSLTRRLDGTKGTSQLMYDGLSSVRENYSQEIEARRMAEEEVSRLRIELSGQAARLTMLTSEDRKQELQKQFFRELSQDLAGLEMNLSKLKTERDVALAEVEELSASKNSASGEITPVGVTRSLTSRLDKIRNQYMTELAPLKQQREQLKREIAELKEAKVIALEEAAVLSARNDELAQLNGQYEHRLDPDGVKSDGTSPLPDNAEKTSFDTWNSRQHQAPLLVNTTSTSSTATFVDDTSEGRQLKPVKPETSEAQATQRSRIGLRWPGNRMANKDSHPSSSAENFKGAKRVEHTFQQVGTLRIGRCDFCNDKMWGSQVRCLACNMTVHVRCVTHVHTSCSQDPHSRSDDHRPSSSSGPLSQTVFGRDLIEQVREDSKEVDLFVPGIVEKCIAAVEGNGMEYEGIYRKNGGTGLSKTITSLFERGDYDSFDLSNPDIFNDISSITSVLKNYFRTLPNPLLTFGLHDAFVSAAIIKDAQIKGQALRDLVRQLPAEHYHTLAHLMAHLHRVQQHADVNLMNARNLGVIFGPTLMRAKDPSREFSDMAGKSLAIEWLIENALTVFPPAT